jgi:hypothetical protein
MQAPPSAAQVFALVVGAALLAVGVLALIFGSTDFGTGSAIGGETFVIWLANGWDAVIWAGFGAAGLLAAVRASSARAYALLTGAFFAVVAVWGFIDGNDVFGLMAVDTTDNVSHAVIGGLGLVAAMLPAPETRHDAAGRHTPPGAYGTGHPSGV